jgi:glutamate carboxypeptidase
MMMARDHQSQLRWIDQQLPAMRDELLQLSAINSGSFNTAGVNAVAQRLRALFAPLQAECETIPVAPYLSTADDGSLRERALGHALRLRKRPDAPLRIFLCGHMDTVFGAEHPFQRARQTDVDTLVGPGVADLKGGMLVMLLALGALERSEWSERVGWEILFNPDEEIGSKSSMPLLAEAAKRNHLGLIYEPAFADGNLASERKGSGNFDVIVHGRSAHAGRDHPLGRNAIRAAADFIAALDQLNGQRDGLTINPGYIRGGGALNIVPELCVFKFNVRTSQAADECWMQDQLDLLLTRLNQREGFRLELRGGFTRPPKLFDARNRQLAGLIHDCGRRLGLDLQFKPTGGCCDGNNLSAFGLPNIDNLGVVGGEIHSDREFMRISSLAERGKLSALLLLGLASGDFNWPQAHQ